MNTELLIFKSYSENDFTDTEYLKVRELDISVKKFCDLIQDKNFKSEYASKILNTIICFNNGEFIPEKVNAYEPINEVYNETKKEEMVSWVSQAGGAVLFKRTKNIKYSAQIENERISKIWSEGKSNTTFNDPKYLSKITLFFDKVKPENFKLIENLCHNLNQATQNSISYLYKGVNIDCNPNEFNEVTLIEELTKYNSQLIKVFK